MSSTLMSLAQSPIARREFPVAPEPMIPAGVPTMQGQGSSFAPLDTVDPTALLMLGAGFGQTVPQTSRLYALAENATNFAGTTPLVRGGVRAFHGSPHDFDRFDMRRIGTGEGAQAYGHGLYFAENEGVARSYRDVLSRNLPHYQAAPSLIAHQRLTKEMDRLHTRMVDETIDRYGRPANSGADGWGDLSIAPHPDVVARYQSQWDDLARRATEARADYDRIVGTPNPGRMYEVNLNVDPNRLLDWDAPLSGQSAEVRAAVNEAVRYQRPAREALEAHRATYGEPAGKHIYGALESLVQRGGDNMWAGNPQGSRFAAEELRDNGIPGIRYLDQGSRSAGDGTRNYVMFDDSLIEILRKYGIAGLGLGLGALSYGGEQQQ